MHHLSKENFSRKLAKRVREKISSNVEKDKTVATNKKAKQCPSAVQLWGGGLGREDPVWAKYKCP